MLDCEEYTIFFSLVNISRISFEITAMNAVQPTDGIQKRVFPIYCLLQWFAIIFLQINNHYKSVMLCLKPPVPVHQPVFFWWTISFTDKSSQQQIYQVTKSHFTVSWQQDVPVWLKQQCCERVLLSDYPQKCIVSLGTLSQLKYVNTYLHLTVGEINWN